MIVRMWRGRAAAGRPDDDPAHFNNAALPELQNVPGFVNAVPPDGDAIRGAPIRPIRAAFRLTSLGKTDKDARHEDRAPYRHHYRLHYYRGLT